MYNNVDHLGIRCTFGYSQAKELGLYTSICPTFLSFHERACLRGELGENPKKYRENIRV